MLEPRPKPASPVRYPFFFGLPRLATAFVGTALVTMTLPLVVIETVGPLRKGWHLGAITGIAALLSLVIVYGAARHSDRNRRRLGRRNHLLTCMGLLLLPLAFLACGGDYTLTIAAFVVLIVLRFATDAAHMSILADPVGAAGKERVAATVAFCHFLGAAGGALAFGYLPQTSWIGSAELPTIIAVPTMMPVLAMGLVILGLAGFAMAMHPEAPCDPASDLIEELSLRRLSPAMRRNLISLILCRVFFQAGILIVSTFLVYMVRDLLAAENLRQAAARLFAGAMSGALLCALPAGRMTERAGEKRMLWGAGGVLAVVVALFVGLGAHSELVAILCMVLYGAAFATLMAAGLSLTVRIVPSAAMAGRMMALVTGSNFAAQFLASAAGALLLDPLNRLRPNLGYHGLVVAIEFFFLAGAVGLARIRLDEVRKEAIQGQGSW